MTTQRNREASGNQELVLHYTDVDGRLVRIFVVGMFGWLTAGGLLALFVAVNSLLVFAGLPAEKAWVNEIPANPSALEVFQTVALGVLGSLATPMFGLITFRSAVIEPEARPRGLVATTVEHGVRGQTTERSKPRHYEWRDIDKFILAGSIVEGRLSPRVGFSYSMGRRRTLANKLWRISGPPRDRDGTKVDVVVMGNWDRPLDEAVDLMNGWLAHNKAV